MNHKSHTFGDNLGGGRAGLGGATFVGLLPNDPLRGGISTSIGPASNGIGKIVPLEVPLLEVATGVAVAWDGFGGFGGLSGAVDSAGFGGFGLDGNGGFLEVAGFRNSAIGAD